MDLYLARHTQTNYNVLGLANSDPAVDVHLTKTGVEQAEQLAESLRDKSFEVIYVSELPRTHHVAEIINHYHHVPVVVDARINDNRTGFEGKPVIAWEIATRATGDRWHAHFGDGESLLETQARVVTFVRKIQRSGYQGVLVVTHGFVTQVINGYLTGQSLEDALKFDLKQGTYAHYKLPGRQEHNEA